MRPGVMLDERSENNHYTRPVEIASAFAGLGSFLGAAPPAVKAKLAKNATGAQAKPPRAARQATMARATAKSQEGGVPASAVASAPQQFVAKSFRQARYANVPFLSDAGGVGLDRLNPMTRVYEPEVRAALAGVDGWTDIFKPVVSAVASVIPSHTIVGKLVNGDTQGAASAAGDYAQQIIASQQPPPIPPPPALFAPQTQTQKYLLYGAAGLGAVLILSVVLRKSPLDKMMQYQMARSMAPARR